MATSEQRARHRAQRATAARVKAEQKKGGKYVKVLPKYITRRVWKSQLAYGNRVIDGTEVPTTRAEKRVLARLASHSRWGHIDPRYYEALKQYLYKDKGLDEPEDDDDEE